MKKIYKVEVQCTETSYYEIVADSETEAEDFALSGEYDHFIVDKDWEEHHAEATPKI